MKNKSIVMLVFISTSNIDCMDRISRLPIDEDRQQVSPCNINSPRHYSGSDPMAVEMIDVTQDNHVTVNLDSDLPRTPVAEIDIETIAQRLGLNSRIDSHIPKEAHNAKVKEILERFKDTHPAQWQMLVTQSAQQQAAHSEAVTRGIPNFNVGLGSGDVLPFADYLIKEVITEDVHLLGREITKERAQKLASLATSAVICTIILGWNVYLSQS